MRSTRHSALRWILVPEAARASVGSTLTLGDEKLKHLKRVLRMEWDEHARVSDGRGKLYEARLVRRGETGAVELLGLEREDPCPPETELVLCLPKNTTADWVVEKAVECGVSRIVPVVSSRSVVKVDPREDAKYVRRWQFIMDAAVEQAERTWRPEVLPPISWNDWTAGNRAEEAVLSLAFVSEVRAEKDEAVALRETWSQLSRSGSNPARLLVGPEGGLSADERADLARQGWEEASLGATVLRVETAVISALMLLRVSRIVSAS